MRLSLRALELCRVKFGKGYFCGFEQPDETLLDGLTEESVRQDFEELSQNEMLAFTDGGVHISALGQHILNMMLSPEQYIMLDNEAVGLRVRFYFRNTYYLCVIEDKSVTSDDSYERYTLQLLPRLEQVIGSFVYALLPNRTLEQREDEITGQAVWGVCRAWDKERTLVAERTIWGNWHGENIQYEVVESVNGVEGQPQTADSDVSEFTNQLTRWLFLQLSAAYQREER